MGDLNESVPVPPGDLDVRNIIDKLAQFVARNGPAFEAMTKEKQKDNPKFGFLFGGEWYEYYRSRVRTEEQELGRKNDNNNPLYGVQGQESEWNIHSTHLKLVFIDFSCSPIFSYASGSM
jgi:hypothetical protein